jgi:aminomethyltransferase
MQTKAIPRAEYRIFSGSRDIGFITSGTRSPSLGRGIAMAYINSGAAKLGDVVEVDIRGRREPAEVVKRKFYTKQLIEHG